MIYLCLQYVQEIGTYLNNTFLAVERIKLVLEDDYRKYKYKKGISRNDSRQCCLTKDNDYVYSNEFMTKVSRSPDRYGNTRCCYLFLCIHNTNDVFYGWTFGSRVL